MPRIIVPIGAAIMGVLIALLVYGSQQLGATHARLDQLSDQMAIYQLEGEYARTWDTGDADGWANLFSDDGVFEMVAVEKFPAAKYQGRPSLAVFCTETNQRFQGVHLMHIPSITIQGERAEGWIHFQFNSSAFGHITGVYRVTYQKTEQGWKIARRIEQITDYLTPETDGYFDIPGEYQ